MRKPANRERGWKLDPKDSTQTRFWNGITWTQQLVAIGPDDAELYAAAERGENVELPAPPQIAAVAATGPEPKDPAVSAGWALAILIPPIGLLVGLALLVRGEDEGIRIVIGAVLAGITWILLIDAIRSGII